MEDIFLYIKYLQCQWVNKNLKEVQLKFFFIYNWKCIDFSQKKNSTYFKLQCISS